MVAPDDAQDGGRHCEPVKANGRPSTEIGKAQVEKVVDVAALDGKRAVHIGLTGGAVSFETQSPGNSPLANPDRDRW